MGIQQIFNIIAEANILPNPSRFRFINDKYRQKRELHKEKRFKSTKYNTKQYRISCIFFQYQNTLTQIYIS